MTSSTFLFILTGVLLNAGAQLLLKAGVHPLGAITVEWTTLVSTMGRVLTQWPIVAGLACYVVSVGVWIVGLSRVDVSHPAVHLFSYFRSLGWREGILPNAERLGRGLLTLPLFPGMHDSDVERVCMRLAQSCKHLLS